jgi:hypothetical protein
MLRRAFAAFALLSLLLCIAAIVLTVRGYIVPEAWVWHTQSASGPTLLTRTLTLDSEPGIIAFAAASYDITLPSPALAAAYETPFEDLTGHYTADRRSLAPRLRRGTFGQRLGLDLRRDDGAADQPPQRLFANGVLLKTIIELHEDLAEPLPATQHFRLLSLPAPLLALLLALPPAAWLCLRRRARRRRARSLVSKWGE